MKILSVPYLNNKFLMEKLEIPGFDYYEIRADYSDFPKWFSDNFFKENIIFTVRDIKEGGKLFFDDATKLKFYKRAIARGSLVDCEIPFYKKYKNSLDAERVILSYHNFNRSISRAELDEIIAIGKEVKFIKIALKIDSYIELDKISEWILPFSNIIFVSMGKTGLISRYLYKKFHSAATYVGIDDFATADNQLTLSRLFFDISAVDNNTKIGGLVGGNQVIFSRGLKFYNDYFKKNSINAVYLPFPTDNLDDFISWFTKKDFYGLSITMPFKEQIAKILDLPEGIYNLLTFDKKLLNTDKIAFEKAKNHLDIKTSDKVVIYGSGAMAKLAIEVFSGCNLYIFARDKQKAKLIAEKYNLLTDLPLTPDLLINCTPVGLCEDFFKTINLQIKPKKIIDLPYDTKKETSLITYAKHNNLLFVDGNMFWHWQAERQLQEFLRGGINNF